MSHEIGELDRPMYGSNKAAWHGLGTVVLGQPTSDEALKLAQLDWTVEVEPVFLSSENGQFIPVAGRATVRMDLPRTDARRFLGAVKGRYQPIQNVESFRIADDLMQGGAHFESAGSLRNGRLVWMLAQLPNAVSVMDDTISKYLLLTNSHDGTRAMEVLYTPVRVVCMNTLTLALNDSTTRVRVLHTSNADTRIRQAREILSKADGYFNNHGETMASLAQTKVNDAFVKTYLEHLFGNNQQSSNKINRVRTLFYEQQSGAGQDAVRGTAYGLFNAVAEFNDHLTKSRTRKSSGITPTESRMERILWKTGADFRQTSFDLLTDGLKQVESMTAVN